MSATNAFETALLEHLLENAALANVGDASGLQPSASAGNLYVSLLVGDPGETGAVTDEATFTGYARVAIPRNGAAWTISNGSAVNASDVEFAECTGGSNTITHFGIHTAASGAGNMILYGALDVSLPVSNGFTVRFAAGDLEVTCD